MYVFAVQQALVTCWRAANGICSKRLVPYLPELVRVLEHHGELPLEAQTKVRLLALSPATADRLLQAERQLAKPHGLSTTKPGTLLKSAIPIRTFAEWDEAVAGFTEIDLVVHCGTTTRGEYLHSLTVTDVATGWTECVALRTRGQQSVFQAPVLARERVPFPLRGIDSDNGSEFINAHLLRYCQEQELTFTRSRPYKKNDHAKTPYQRVLESAQVSEEVKTRLHWQYATLNPVALLRQIQRLQAGLWKLAAREPTEQGAAHASS